MSLGEGMRDLYAIFERVLGEAPARREAFLAAVCVDKPDLRLRIARLLVLAESGVGFLDRSPLDLTLGFEPVESTYGPGHRIGAYRLMRRLGSGGMAEVWLAERAEGGFHQRAAVKIIRDARESVGALFATEREILASLVHPGIARLYDGGVDAGGSAYMVMEYVEGEHLIAYCNARRLGLGERLALFLDICDAVAYAHTQLVVHRDLKPANILVAADGVVKLLDFGIAKVIDRDGAKEITRTLHMSPAYAAPEQLAGGTIGTATDVYALGVILFELLTGTLPWTSEVSSLTLAVKRLLDTPAPVPSRIVTAESPVSARAIAGDLDAIVGMALRREPAARYPDARALADEIRRHLDHKPVHARTGARTYVLRRFLRRHWIGLAATAGLFVAMAVAIVVIAWQERRSESEAQRAAAVQSFMVDLFRMNSSRQPDPVKARQTTARELLDIGATRIEKELSDAPAEKLELLRMFGDLYDDLGMKPEQLRLRHEAVDLTRTLYGNRSVELASELIALSAGMSGTEEQGQREAVLGEAAAVLDARQDNDSVLRGRLFAALAEALEASDPKRGFASARQAVDVLSRYPQSSDLAEALYLLGLLTQYTGNGTDAIAPLKRAIAISRAIDGVPNPKLPIYYYQLAESETLAFHLDEAEATAREGLRIAVAMNGEDHIHAMRLHLMLGDVLLAGDRIREGLDQVLEAKAQLPGLVARTDSLHRPVILRAAGLALFKAGDFDGALEDLQSSLGLVRTIGKLPLVAANTLEDIADVLMDLGRVAAARAAFEEAADIRREIAQTAGKRTAFIAARLAESEGRLDEARALLGESGADPAASPSETVAYLVRATLAARIELDAGHLDEAKRLAASASAIAHAADFAAALETKIASSELIEGLAMLRGGDAAGARPLLERTLATREAKLLPKSPLIAEAELALAECDVAEGRRASALARVERASAIEEQHSSLSAEFTEPLARLRAAPKARPATHAPSAS